MAAPWRKYQDAPPPTSSTNTQPVSNQGLPMRFTALPPSSITHATYNEASVGGWSTVRESHLDIRVFDAMCLDGMTTLRVTKLAVWLLLLVFGLNLAGQVASTIAMAAPVVQSVETRLSAQGSCPSCIDGTNDLTMAQCASAFCCAMAALPARGPAFDRFEPLSFFVIPAASGVGVSPGPALHPPKSSLLA